MLILKLHSGTAPQTLTYTHTAVISTTHAQHYVEGRSKFLSSNKTMQTQSLPSGSGSVTLALFTDVRNSPQLRSQAAAGKIPAALLATTLVGTLPST